MTVVKWLDQRGVKGKHEEAEQETAYCDDLTPPFSLLARTWWFHFMLKLDKPPSGSFATCLSGTTLKIKTLANLNICEQLNSSYKKL